MVGVDSTTVNQLIKLMVRKRLDKRLGVWNAELWTQGIFYLFFK